MIVQTRAAIVFFEAAPHSRRIVIEHRTMRPTARFSITASVLAVVATLVCTVGAVAQPDLSPAVAPAPAVQCPAPCCSPACTEASRVKDPHAPKPEGMSSEALAAIWGAVIGVAGALGVFLLTALDQRRRDKRALAERRKATRALVHAEIEHNLRLLAGYLSEARDDNPTRIASNNTTVDWVAQITLPTWSSAAWQGTIAELVAATTEQELLDAFRLYAELATLTNATQAAKELKLMNGVPPAEVVKAFGEQHTVRERLAAARNPLTRPAT
jgi:hypothetical protein